MFGRRRVFTVRAGDLRASARCSPGRPGARALIAGRVVQGVGAAPMLPLSLALVCDAFPTERAGPGAGDLGGGLGAGARDRPAGRRPPGRTRLAADLLDQRAGAGARGRDLMLAVVPETRDESATRPARPRRAGRPRRRADRGRPALVESATGGRLGARPSAARRRARARSSPSGASSTGSRSRSSSSSCSATGPTSAPAPPPSPWSAPTGR